MKATVYTAICICLSSMIGATVQAEDIVKPYSFTNGTPADAEQVNQNFDALYQKVNELQAEVNALNSAAGQWPDGSYCILQGSYSCPIGFTRFFSGIRAINTYSTSGSYLTPGGYGGTGVGLHNAGNTPPYNVDFTLSMCCK